MKERIARIEVETGHLVQMVNEMLDLARIEGGSQLRLEDDVDLGRLAAASAERLRLFAERSGVTLATEVAPGLPTVRGDEARLGQVFVNLVHNAVKFSPDGGEVAGRGPARRRRRRGRRSTDHGIGIARADRARIFERFYKADRARVARRRHGPRPRDRPPRRRGPRGPDPRRVARRASARRSRSPSRFAPPDTLAARRPKPDAEEPAVDRLLVATLNILNLADRWDERLPLLLADMAALQPDLIGPPRGRLPAPAGPAPRGGGGGPLRGGPRLGRAGRSTATASS